MVIFLNIHSCFLHSIFLVQVHFCLFMEVLQVLEYLFSLSIQSRVLVKTKLYCLCNFSSFSISFWIFHLNHKEKSGVIDIIWHYIF